MSPSSPPPEPPTPPIDLHLIDRYLSGSASVQERIQLRALLAADPSAARVFDELSGASRPEATVRDVDADWAAHRRRVFGAPVAEMSGTSERRGAAMPSTSSSVSTVSRRPRFLTRPFIASVTGAALVAVAAFAVRSSSDARRPAAGSRTAATYVTYTTRNGQRADITFPDGGTAVLNVGSRLEVPTNYSAGNRTVRLVGEALFTVAHHTGTPFTVMTGAISTRVLGTNFLVRRYPTDTATTVAVRDGKVAVQSTVVTANQQVVVDRANRVRIGRADPSRFTFATGVLTLDGVSLRDAIPDLNRWYDADIRIADSALATNRIQATFTAGSLSNLSAILEMAFGVRVARNGRVLTLYQE